MRVFDNQQQKDNWLNDKRAELKAQGLSDEEIEIEIDALSECNWTQRDYADWYGDSFDD